MENTKRAHREKSRIRPSGRTYVESKDLLSGLERVREAARRDSQTQFTALFHHITVELLRESYGRQQHNQQPQGISTSRHWNMGQISLGKATPWAFPLKMATPRLYRLMLTT